METLLRCIYAGQKYSQMYTLSISTGKNHSTKVHDALYIPTYEYTYKVVISVTQYCKNITSTIGANTKLQREIQL